MKKQSAKRKKSVGRRVVLFVASAIVLIICVLGAIGASMAFKTYQGKPVELFIGPDFSDEDVERQMVKSLGEDYGSTLYRLWTWRVDSPARSVGLYLINTGDKAWSVVNRLRIGVQTPRMLTFNNIRLMDDLATRVSNVMLFSPEDFKAACDSVLPSLGYTPEEYPAAFIPDSYQVFVTQTAPEIVKRLVSERDKFWNAERLAKADTLGLTPVQVATLASIVEEESAKTDEHPVIARLYLNRLERGMKLQADPTVKFAVGDFTIRRVLNTHLQAPSAYNTYLNEGLPPGPIRIPAAKTIDAVLNAPHHDYIYMCAKEDFSGYHNFTTSYADHLSNARRYQSALNRLHLH